MKNYLACAALMAGLASSPAVAATIQYTDEAAFLSRLTSVSVEDFNDGSVDSPLTVSSAVGFVDGGVWNDRLDPNGATTTWSFGSAINGFGGLWNLAGPGGEGTGIALTLTLFGGAVELLSFEVSNTLSGQFFGFISDQSFTSVLFSAGTQGGFAETYNLDNLTTGVAAVPLPAAFGLLAFALGSLCALRRRRRT
ncbi:hypothetical protein EYC08_10135 [Tabrizicola sp. WMC-M-20]|nr:hypothetical protein EYC08_10135 [Tabrizicola sp. WMC-M-20]